MSAAEPNLETTEGMLSYVNSQFAAIVTGALEGIETLRLMLDGFNAENPTEVQLGPRWR